MILFYTASKDASIYLQQPYQNTGIDEILEISKVYYGDTRDNSRILIQFDLNNISKSLVDGTIDANTFTASLELKITEANEIPAKFSIEAYAISGSWEMGTGTRFDNLTTNGTSWYYRNGDNTSTHWYNTMDGITASYSTGVTGSWDGLGGAWYTESVTTQDFNYTLEDIKLDITDFIRNWNSGSYENNGLIIKFSGSLENDTVDYGSLKIFSKESNTIYHPKLVISYGELDTPGDLENILDFAASSSYDVVYRCYSPNLKTSYYKGQTVSIKIDARELYPVKQFNSTFAYQRKYYLPDESYYAIMDTITGEYIIPYSVNTRVIKGQYNNIIKLNFTNWEEGRTYTLFVKSIDDHNQEYFEIGTFEIVK
jgi:hypothetical protein